MELSSWLYCATVFRGAPACSECGRCSVHHLDCDGFIWCYECQRCENVTNLNIFARHFSGQSGSSAATRLIVKLVQPFVARRPRQELMLYYFDHLLRSGNSSLCVLTYTGASDDSMMLDDMTDCLDHVLSFLYAAY